MTLDMLERLSLLAKLLLDARTQAASVYRLAIEQEAHAEDFNLVLDIGILRERVRILLEQGEEEKIRENRGL